MSSATQRADKIAKLFKVAKKYFHPIHPPSNRLLIEHLLYACCLENATFELADEILAKLQDEYFDWNEVRVTTTRELAELMKKLPNPEEAAGRVRRTLHGLFEAHYSFDIEQLRKENLGKAIEQLQKYKGVSPFGIAYATQSVLGGHAIPIDDAMLLLMQVLGIASEDDIAARKITGLERAISKDQGVDFFSVVHQLAVALYNNPFNKDIRGIVLEIDKEAANRFPKRQIKKKKDESPPEAVPAAAAVAAAPATETAKSKTAAAKEKDKKTKAPAGLEAAKPVKKTEKAAEASKAKKAEKPKSLKPKAGSSKKTSAKSASNRATTKAPAKKPVKRKPR